MKVTTSHASQMTSAGRALVLRVLLLIMSLALIVYHIIPNRENNHVDNLQFVTNVQNVVTCE